MTKFPASRVLIILGVLVSLCVSDNVGPRLLPLPPIAEAAPVPGPVYDGHAGSPAPSHDPTGGARVEMLSATQRRAGAERLSPQVAAHSPKFELVIPSHTHSPRDESAPPSAESSAPFSRPKGRAPPSLL
ncbi:MAG TPA: hypothetical protein VGV38_02320 [Pyrinomonadaceae bacterium]|nr:hypothetical protein [Pyrinomonadaceae bacterium]